MENWLTKLAFIAVVCAASFAAVLQFETLQNWQQLKSEMEDVMELVMKPRTPSRYIPASVYQQMGLNPSTRLLSYSWKTCANTSTENFIINNITFSPDPLSFPGPLIVSFDLNLKIDAPSPVKAKVLLEKKVASTWIEIPCIGQVGSCSYNDICPFLHYVQCPPEFVAAKIPCKCPFPKGTYNLPKASFDVEVSFLPTGDYHLRANVSAQNMKGGCYDFYVSME